MHDGLVNRINNLAHHRHSTGPDLHLPTHDIDLNLITVRDSQRDASTCREFSLPPVDEGKDAWLCSMGAFFFLEMVVWGMFPSR